MRADNSELYGSPTRRGRGGYTDEVDWTGQSSRSRILVTIGIISIERHCVSIFAKGSFHQRGNFLGQTDNTDNEQVEKNDLWTSKEVNVTDVFERADNLTI